MFRLIYLKEICNKCNSSNKQEQKRKQQSLLALHFRVSLSKHLHKKNKFCFHRCLWNRFHVFLSCTWHMDHPRITTCPHRNYLSVTRQTQKKTTHTNDFGKEDAHTRVDTSSHKTGHSTMVLCTTQHTIFSRMGHFTLNHSFTEIQKNLWNP